MARRSSASDRAAPWLGVLQVEIGTPWARSLKEKRALLLPLLNRWRARPELSVVRLDDHDAHDVETWALAAVDADPDRLRAQLERARDQIGANGLVVRAARLDLEPWEPLDPRDAIDGVPGSTGPDASAR